MTYQARFLAMFPIYFGGGTLNKLTSSEYGVVSVPICVALESILNATSIIRLLRRIVFHALNDNRT